MRRLLIALAALSLLSLLPVVCSAQATWPYQFQAGSITEDATKITVTKPTYFNSGLTLTSGQLLLPNGTAAAPALAFTSELGLGLYRINATQLGVSNGGALFFSFSPGNFRVYSDSAYIALGNNSDVILARGAAHTLYQRSGTSPQAFWLANSDDGAGNYERGGLRWNANNLELFTDAAGTGTLRAIQVPSTLVTTSLYPTSTDTSYTGASSRLWQHVYVARSFQGSKSKSLTDAAAAVSFVRIAVPTGSSIGGEVIYTATSTNGTAALTRQARWSFAGADAAGTVTCSVGSEGNVATAYSRANTLVCTMTAVTSTTNCDLQITCTDNLAAAQTMSFNWRLDMPLTATVTPQ